MKANLTRGNSITESIFDSIYVEQEIRELIIEEYARQLAIRIKEFQNTPVENDLIGVLTFMDNLHG